MFTREQANVQHYLESASGLHQVIPSPEEAPLREALFAFDCAMVNFGRTEMVIRQVERNIAARLPYAKEDIEAALATFNKPGLEHVKLARDAIGDFRRYVESRIEPGQEYDSKLLDRQLVVFDESYRRELAQLELKPADVKRLVEQLDESLAAARSGDPLAVVDHVSSKLAELASVRASEDRGMIDNIPWWKIVGIAVAAAVTVWGVMRCVFGWFGGRCSVAEGAALAAIGSAAAVVSYFC